SGKNDMMRNSSDYGFTASNNITTTFSYAIYQAFRASNQTLTDLLACAPQGQMNVIVDGKADMAQALLVSGNYFQVLDIGVLAGRTLLPDDDQPSANPVAVISEAYWARRFGMDRSVVGKVVTIGNIPVTIVGVTPADFTGIQNLGNSGRDITLPLSWEPRTALTPVQANLTQPTSWWIQVMGRLKPGATLDQVRGNLEPVLQNTARDGW